MEQQERSPAVKQPPAPYAAARWRRRFFILLAIVVLLPLGLVVYALARFGGDRPVVYDTPEEHFKYGSTGGERESGFPYWIFQALPQVCELSGGYRSLGLVYEEGRDLPIGMSKRRYLGLERTFLNCAVCHTSTVRATSEDKPRVIVGMPANTFDIMAFERFFFDCATNEKFSAQYIVPEARRIARAAGEDIDLIDRYVIYPIAISIMRERLLMLRNRFRFVLRQVDQGLLWGPGRVDTFNSAKVLFNFPMEKLDPKELLGASDFPSIWNQGLKRNMQLHWDGNNTLVEERNKSAAFGTGTTPPTIDLEAVGRVEKWMEDLKAPPYPFAIDKALAAQGAPLYKQYCAACHGASGQDFTGEKVGRVTPLEAIRTDPKRLDSYTEMLAVNQGTLYAGYEHRFRHFRKTFGYANMPLDGLWARAPYLHNGSVPTLRDLLAPAGERPRVFYRGNDVYDEKNVGFVATAADDGKGRRFFRYDTAAAGNSNAGHEGPEYGTHLPPSDKAALLEYLKTF